MGTDDLRDSDGDPDADAIIEEFWPYDGPHTHWKIRRALYAAAELVRYANNATQGGRPANGPTLGALVGSTNALVHRLDQLLGQLAEAAGRVAVDPTLYDDHAPREQGGVTALDLAYQLRNSRVRAVELANSLDRAAQLGSRLGHRSAGE